MRLIDADALMEYCNNLKDKTIDANDIARFPTAVGWISVKDAEGGEQDGQLQRFDWDEVRATDCPRNCRKR